MKYNKKVLGDYIYGNDTDINIEDLENDWEFMLEVIKMTNDKNFYLLCGEKVKTNYNFVKEVILQFKEEPKFICDVADVYLETCENDFDRTELLVIMYNLTKENKSTEYKMLLESKFQAIMVAVELSKLQNPERKKDIGLGFNYIFDQFNASKMIIDCFVEFLLNYIFDEYDINLEEYLHKKYPDFKKIEAIGIPNFLLNFIACFDETLSSYLSSNIKLLDNLIKEMNRINKNWTPYQNKKEIEKMQMILEVAYNYMDEHNFLSRFNEIGILYFIAEELGIAKRLIKYDNLSITEEEYQSFLEEIKLERRYWTLEDYRFYSELKNIIERIMLNDTPEEPDAYIKSKRTNKKADVIDIITLKKL